MEKLGNIFEEAVNAAAEMNNPRKEGKETYHVQDLGDLTYREFADKYLSGAIILFDDIKKLRDLAIARGDKDVLAKISKDIRFQSLEDLDNKIPPKGGKDSVEYDV